MELLRGVSLTATCATSGRMTTAEALPLVAADDRGAGGGAHAGVIHRDFKPGDIVLVPEPGAAPDDPPRLVITDFGLARRPGRAREHHQHRRSAGYAAYMAPEQVTSGVEPITPATDIYALGIVLFEMVTDDMPFKGNSTTVMALKRIKEKPVSPPEIVPDLDPRWEAAIMRCLERHAARRYQNAGDVYAALVADAPTPEPTAAAAWTKT